MFKKVKQLGKLDLCISVQIIRLFKKKTKSRSREGAGGPLSKHSFPREEALIENNNISPEIKFV